MARRSLPSSDKPPSLFWSRVVHDERGRDPTPEKKGLRSSVLHDLGEPGGLEWVVSKFQKCQTHDGRKEGGGGSPVGSPLRVALGWEGWIIPLGRKIIACEPSLSEGGAAREPSEGPAARLAHRRKALRCTTTSDRACFVSIKTRLEACANQLWLRGQGIVTMMLSTPPKHCSGPAPPPS